MTDSTKAHNETIKRYRFIVVGKQSYKVREHWFWDEFSKTSWEPQTYNIFHNYINAQTTYIDIGAWIGSTLIYASQQNPKEMYALEANPLSFELLQENCSLNKSLEKTKLSHLCITDKSDEITGFGGSNNTKNTSSASSINGDCWKVLTKTLTAYLAENKLLDCKNLFIKIDIEGAEELILKDLESLKNKENITICISLHPPFMKDKLEFCKSFLGFCYQFKKVLNSDLEALPIEQLKEMITTDEKYTSWGTSYGNFFEIVLTNKEITNNKNISFLLFERNEATRCL